MTGAVSNVRRVAICLACIAWAGISLQLVLSLQTSVINGGSLGAGLIAYLGFFTILTNLLVCASVTAIAVRGAARSGGSLSSPFLAGGVAANIILVAVSYHVLLRKVWDPQGAALLANVLLHYVTPILYVMFWFFWARQRSLRPIDPLLWSLYPIAYFLYALVRGELIGSYPYGFIDVSVIGYGHTLRNGIVMLLGFIVVGEILVVIDRRTPLRGS